MQYRSSSSHQANERAPDRLVSLKLPQQPGCSPPRGQRGVTWLPQLAPSETAAPLPRFDGSQYRATAANGDAGITVQQGELFSHSRKIVRMRWPFSWKPTRNIAAEQGSHGRTGITLTYAEK